MKYLSILLLFCFGCSGKPDRQAIKLSLINNNTVKFSGFDIAVLHEIDRDTTKTKWQKLLPVYRIPADTELKDYQPAQPGLYKVAKNVVLFMPDTPFIKGQTYFVRFYRYNEGGSVWDIIARKNKPGMHPYTDLIFKP